MSWFLKIIIVFAVSTIKFLVAPALSFGMGLNFLQTWLSTTAGGVTGVVIFFFLSKWMIRIYIRYFSYYFHLVKNKTFSFFNIKPTISIPNKIFTWRNRLIVKTIRKYGLAGVVILTPVLLSIPLGTFLATRYYNSNHFIIYYLIGSVVFWSLFMSSAISLL